MIYQAPEMQPVVTTPKPKKEPKQNVGNPKFKIAQEHKLFDYLKDHLGLKSDAQLAERLNLFNSELSRIRNGILTFSPRVILAVYDATDMTIEEIRELL
jgi:transcriptional regulator with XRE-family HTH domain